MRTVIGSPALALLLGLKLRGLVRRQWRRLGTRKGLVLTLFGCAAFGVWIASLSLSFLRPPGPLLGATGELRVRAFALMLFVLSLSSALTNRGLYLPKNEIERLFSAPLSRAELVRYRLLAGGLRSLFGGLILGAFGARRLPAPPLAFAGILLAMQVLPVVNQLVAIALGGLELRWARLLKHLGRALLVLGLCLLGTLTFVLVSDLPLASLPLLGPWAEALAQRGGDPFSHPLLANLSLPFLPWARLICSDSVASFVPWFLACLALHFLLIEACARLPIDFRELSLATSARAAARLARVRRGGGVAATRASADAARWRIPWLFGRGPGGAIAWRKCAGMARKAQGAFWVALVALAFITFFANLMLPRSLEERALGAPILIALLGTIYLCSGLRFDFREELERMDVIRAWPLAPARVFLATLLPEVALVTLLLGGTVLAQAALTHGLSLHVAGVVACLPFLVFAWVALDNAVFLFAPVRLVPGQDGLVQNAGQRMIQMLLLLLLALVLAGFGALGFWGATSLAGLLGASLAPALAAGYTAILLVLATGDALLVLLGGAVLRRFDVARDRG